MKYYQDWKYKIKAILGKLYKMELINKVSKGKIELNYLFKLLHILKIIKYLKLFINRRFI